MYDLVNSGVEQLIATSVIRRDRLCMTSLIVGSNSELLWLCAGTSAVYDLVNSGVEQLCRVGFGGFGAVYDLVNSGVEQPWDYDIRLGISCV